MACFLVSTVAAIGVGALRHVEIHKEKKLELEPKESLNKFGSETKWSSKLKYLEVSLFGGSFILALEHILHGEVTPFPPFLTAAKNMEDLQQMFVEMATVGVSMLVLVVVCWAVGVFLWDYSKFKKRKTSLKEIK